MSISNETSIANPQLFAEVGDFYVLKRFEEVGHLPEYINIDGKIYKRFLEIFYLDKKLSELSIKNVLSLCDLRQKNLKKVASLEYNKHIICKLIKAAVEPAIQSKLSNSIKILDYGIGSGISMDCIKEIDNDNLFELVGTDISHNALRECARKGINEFIQKTSNIFHLEVLTPFTSPLYSTSILLVDKLNYLSIFFKKTNYWSYYS